MPPEESNATATDASNPTDANGSAEETTSTLLGGGDEAPGDDKSTGDDTGDTASTDEGTADKDSTDDAGADGDDEGEGEGAPESYGDFEVPEGMQIDESMLEKVNPVFKDLNLTQEQAQKLVGVYAEAVQEATEAQQTAWAETVNGWLTELKDDKVLGGENLGENAGIAKRAIDMFGDDSLKTALDETGMGNHPALFKFMHRIGNKIVDGKFVQGEPGHTDKSRADRMYPPKT